MAQRRESTHTSNFGVSRRENHDASAFYARFTPPQLTIEEQISPEPARAIDRIFTGDAREMAEIEDASVALVVTSPPYFAGKEYEQALGGGDIPATYLEYLQMLEEVFAECVRTLEPGGRIAVNVANLGRRPYRSLSSDVIAILQDRLRLLLRGEVIWQKARGSSGSCAWGSFQRPANPVLRDLTERVVIASKGRFDRAVPARERARRGLPSTGSLSSDEFMEATTDVWDIPPESATRVGHAAPFPVALPERLIHLYTYYGDLVLDPFLGSGSTAVAALRTGRHYAGYDLDPEYVALAQRRIQRERESPQPDPGEYSQAFRVPAVPEPPNGEDFQARAVRDGVAARRLARALLEECGFTDLDAKHVPHGVEVSFRAKDARGREWLFEVTGGFTSTRPGLRRTDTMWKALGKAAVLHQVAPTTPLVLLTTDRPAPASGAAAALQAVTGAGKPIRAVLRIALAEDQARLRAFAQGNGGA